MPVFDQGGGGGKAGVSETDLSFILSKPYDLAGNVSPETLEQINQMFEELYRALRQTTAEVAGQRLLGRYGAASGSMQQIELGDNLTLSDAGVLSAGGGDSIVGVGDALLSVVTIEVTDTEIQSLNTTPKVIISAPAGRIVVPILLTAATTKAATAWASTANLNLRHSNGDRDLMETGILMGLNSASGRTLLSNSKAGDWGATGLDFSTYDPTGRDVKIRASADPSKSGGGDASVTATCIYYAFTQ